MRMVQTAAILRSSTKVTSTIYTKDIFTVPIRIMSTSMRWRRMARIHPLALRHMDVARTMVNTLMVPVADTRRCLMAVTPTISSKATFIMRIRGTATTTAPSRWLDENQRGSVAGRPSWFLNSKVQGLPLPKEV
jgi:hypothetical protein